MTYSQALKLESVASGLIPDGYCGHMTEVTWRFDPQSGKTLTMWKRPEAQGFFNSGLPPALNTVESEWLVRNHPITREWIVR